MAKKSKTPIKMATPDRDLEYEKIREDFLSEADKKTPIEAERAEEKENEFDFPWQEPGVSERVLKSFNLRLSEPDFLKLKFVARRSQDKSMHAFCARVVMEEVKRQLKKEEKNGQYGK